MCAEKRRMPFKTLASSIGMSEGNLHRCVRENKIQASDLEKIAKVLNVSVGYFFEEDTLPSGSVRTEGDFSPASLNGNVTNNVGAAAVLKDKIKSLEALLAEKERTIRILLSQVETPIK